MAYKNPLELSDDLLREARKQTLNKRINYKGNYENFITGGSSALDNQVGFDSNDYVKGMTSPGNGWDDDPWVNELNDRYTNPQHNARAGAAPYGSKLKYIHDQTPSTRRGRRASDIYHHTRTSPYADDEFRKVQRIVKKYEGWR